ncbi:hypothetical protein AB4342_19655, partial [Vibrio breoganii]
LEVPEITHATTHQKRYESSLDTVGRVLGNISLVQRETWEQSQTDVQVEQNTNPAPELPTELPIELTEQPAFDCAVASFIKEQFDFKVLNGAIQLPVNEVNTVIQSMVNSDCETWNPRTAKLAIHSSNEVVVNE